MLNRKACRDYHRGRRLPHHRGRRPHHIRVRGVRAAAAPQHRNDRRGRQVPGGRRHVELADRPAPSRLDEPRPGFPRVGRGRQRVRRHARRVRRLDRRPRPPRDRRGGVPAGRTRHALRPAHRGRHLARRRAGPPLRPAAVAVRQLRHRGDHGRHPPDARADRARPGDQGRGLLPRAPRLGAGLRAARARGGRPGRRTAARARQHRHPAGDHGPHRRRALQRPRRRGAGARRPPRPHRRHDPRADHDERRDHPARGRPTSSAWPRRWGAASPWPPSVGWRR